MKSKWLDFEATVKGRVILHPSGDDDEDAKQLIMRVLNALSVGQDKRDDVQLDSIGVDFK